MKPYPILNSRGEYIPFELMLEHQDQCFKNHGQSVETLASRGGTDYLETYFILIDAKYGIRSYNNEEFIKLEEQARKVVLTKAYEWLMKNNKLIEKGDI